MAEFFRDEGWAGAWRRSCRCRPRGQRARSDELRELPVELIAPNPNNPGGGLTGDAAGACRIVGRAGGAAACAGAPKAGGTYELVAGERRWRAAQLAGLETIPALVRPATMLKRWS